MLHNLRLVLVEATSAPFDSSENIHHVVKVKDGEVGPGTVKRSTRFPLGSRGTFHRSEV